MSLAAPVSPTPTFLFLALGPCCTQPLNLRQSLLARCWRCRPQYCDCSSLACRAASICCASHAAASSKAAPPLSGATKFSHCLHEHVSCLARRTIRVRRVRCVRAEDSQVGWAVTPSSDGAKANRCCCANESGDTRLLAAGRANRDSGGRRQPAETDGLSEVKLPPHVGPVVRQPWRRDVCMQTARHPGDRTCQLGSSRALVARGACPVE